MQSDEQQIRDNIARWHAATAKSDLDTILGLMADDVVLLIAGQAPMQGKESFAAGFRKITQTHRIESIGEVQEIQVSGDLAYCWTQLQVSVTPLAGGEAKRRSGPTLTIFRKSADGRWELLRDANLLTADEGLCRATRCEAAL